MSKNANRNLLFGILAVQTDLISREALLAAARAWVTDKERPLGEILEDHGRLGNQERTLLEALVQNHLSRHGNDAARSLEALSSVETGVRKQLEDLGDTDLAATLSHVGPGGAPAADDPQRTTQSVMPPDTAPHTLGASSTRGARFRILRPHAKGGLGQVSVALDGELNREVALKEIQVAHADDTGSRQRFVQEAEITGGLEHPGIVPVYGLGQYADGRPFYAMRFVRGDSLGEAIDRFHLARGGGPYDQGERAVEFRKLLGRFVDICNAIEYAHSRGILHRDLKPGNVMLGKYGETLVVDWGLAKPVDRDGAASTSQEPSLQPNSGSGLAATQMGQAVGTPAYMSPEQAAGRLDRLGPGSDVYSLGATLYSLLTGRAPFTGSPKEVLSKVAAGAFQSPRSKDGQVPRPLNAICLKAMSTSYDQRYGSPAELAEEVERYLADEPVDAYSEPLVVRARRWVRRHQTVVTGVAAAVAVAVIGLGGGLALLSAKNQQLETARARSQARFTLALEAIEHYYTGASEDVLLKQEKLTELRAQLLAQPLAFYERLRDELEGESDPESREQLAIAYFAIGRITLTVGSAEDAEQAIKRATDYYSHLADEYPGVARYAKNLATAHNYLGMLLSDTGRSDKALDHYGRARNIQERLWQQDRTNGDYQRDLAGTNHNLGMLYTEMARPVDGLSAYERARDIRERLVNENPALFQYQGDLATTYNNLGVLYADTGRPQLALATYEQAREIQERLATEHPTVDEYQSDLAGTLINLGTFFSDGGQPEQAYASLEQARELQEKLADQNPTVSEYRYNLASTYNNLAILHTTTGQPQEALAAYERARDLFKKLALENPTVTEYQEKLATSYRNLALLLGATSHEKAAAAYERAREVFDRLVTSHPDLVHLKRDLARTCESLGTIHRTTGRPADALEAYECAHEMFTGLVTRTPSDNADANDLAKVCNNLGGMYLTMGRPSEGATAWEQAREIRERLVAQHPEVSEYQSNLASTYSNLGILYRAAGRLAQTEAIWERALKIHKRLTAEYPAVAEYQRDLAATCHNLGVIHVSLNKPTEALALYEQARVAREKLAADGPTNPEARRELALTLDSRGTLLRNIGELDEALGSHRRALDILERLCAEHPAIHKYHQELAAICGNLGILNGARGALVEAQRAYERAREIQLVLVNRYPEIIIYQSDLAATHGNLGALLGKVGSPEKALESYREAREIFARLAKLHPENDRFAQLAIKIDLTQAEILRGLERFAESADSLARVVQAAGPQPDLRVQLAWSRAKAGDHTSALDAVDGLAADAKQPSILYNIACVYSLASEAARRDDGLNDDERMRLGESHARRAVEILEQVHGVKFFSAGENLKRLKSNSELDPLRDRDDFRRLIEELDSGDCHLQHTYRDDP